MEETSSVCAEDIAPRENRNEGRPQSYHVVRPVAEFQRPLVKRNVPGGFGGVRMVRNHRKGDAGRPRRRLKHRPPTPPTVTEHGHSYRWLTTVNRVLTIMLHVDVIGHSVISGSCKSA